MRYRYISIIIVYINWPHIVTREASLLVKKPSNVDLINLIFLSLTNVKCGPHRRRRTSNSLGQGIIYDIIGYIFWYTLLAMQYEIRTTLCIPTRCTPCTMNITILTAWQMIMYDMTHLGDIKSASCKVCTNEHITTATSELIERTLTQLLLHTTVIDFKEEFLLMQIPSHSIYRFAMIAEDNGLSTSKCTQ